MSEYRLLIAYEVFIFLEKQPSRERKRLRDSFVQINAWPAKYSDFKEPDETGRFLDVHICGRYSIRYWEDFADRHVKILDVSMADR